MMHVMDWTPTLASVSGIPLEEMGEPLSGFDHWSAIIGEAPESALPVRNELVLGRNSYIYDNDSEKMVKTTQSRGAFIYDGWKINIGDKCTGWFSFNPHDDLKFDPQCTGGECLTCTDQCLYVNAEYNTFLFNLDEDPFEKLNLVHDMPEKFEDMVERWNKACEGEVPALYKESDSKATKTWKAFHHWVVAWQ